MFNFLFFLTKFVNIDYAIILFIYYLMQMRELGFLVRNFV